MNTAFNKKILLIIKIFSVLLLIYSIMPILTVLGIMLNPDLVQSLNIRPGQAILEQAAIFTYCVIGGTGLLLKKRWALYFVMIPGLISLFFVGLGLATYVLALQYGNAYAPDLITIFLRTFLGVFSIILYRNRKSLNRIFL